MTNDIVERRDFEVMQGYKVSTMENILDFTLICHTEYPY